MGFTYVIRGSNFEMVIYLDYPGRNSLITWICKSGELVPARAEKDKTEEREVWNKKGTRCVIAGFQAGRRPGAKEHGCPQEAEWPTAVSQLKALGFQSYKHKKLISPNSKEKTLTWNFQKGI